MLNLYELYSSVYSELKKINDDFSAAIGGLYTEDIQSAAMIEKRIANLKYQLEKIDEYTEKVEYYRQMAEKHIASRNLLTITPRELNFNRLRNWAMMIDPDETDDPYAQRIYVQTKCNLLFLEMKRQEFTHLVEVLENGEPVTDNSEEGAGLRAKFEADCREVIDSSDFAYLVNAVAERHSIYLSDKETVTENPAFEQEFTGLGIYALPLPVPEGLRNLVKSRLQEWYDASGSRILLPAEYATTEDTIISIDCTASREKKMYLGLQNYILNIIAGRTIGLNKICFIDGLHYNNSTLGMLRPLEGSAAVGTVPRTAEQIEDTLKEIVSSFSDIDETLGFVDSVSEYNKTADNDKKIPKTVLVLIGYPNAFSSESKKCINRILTNYEHYGITPVLVNTQYIPKKKNIEAAVFAGNTVHIRLLQNEETIRYNSDREYYFKWYDAERKLSKHFISEVKKHNPDETRIGTVYTKRVSLEAVPPYERGKKNISLLYGVDAKDEAHSISFDNENFAAYLMGASGSGKSTLLHTLITGIIRNYHPDDVELWLADFKMSEFAQYINPLPPHVKYILLDESPELVYDLIDKLTEKMMERQRFFMKNRELKKVENVPKDIYMPVIFVILDEFSIMSQSIAESQTYKLRLQNLLAKGRALGIKFLFSSQTFTSGISGLTTTAKAQIQSRIAMKNSKEEINETLELSLSQRTDQVKNWIDVLPPHYALYKYRDGDSIKLERLQVMYFDGKGEAAFAPQRRLIEKLNTEMHSVPEGAYDSSVPDAYVYKDPVIVDGNSYDAFDEQSLLEQMKLYRQQNPDETSENEIIFSPGTPRRMSNFRFSAVTSETRENMLLVGGVAEQVCCTSVLLSVMKQYVMQNGKVQIWAYGRNRLFRAYKGLFSECGFEIIEGMDAVCDAIYNLRQDIHNKKNDNKLIVMIGMERIYMDFDFSEGNADMSDNIDSTIAEKRKEWEKNGAVIASDEEEAKRKYAIKWMSQRKKVMKQAESEGKSKEEIAQILKEAEIAFRKEFGFENPVKTTETPPAKQEQRPEKSDKHEPKPRKSGAYDAKDDFMYIMKQGSRSGYHFLLNLTSCADLKQMKLRPDMFRYKAAFQIPVDDSRDLFANKSASQLPEHICQFDDMLDRYSFRPYLHKGIGWDGWYVDSDGKVITPYDDMAE